MKHSRDDQLLGQSTTVNPQQKTTPVETTPEVFSERGGNLAKKIKKCANKNPKNEKPHDSSVGFKGEQKHFF